MPLSEKLRIDAGRPFIQTLIARIYVAGILMIIMIIMNDGHKIGYPNVIIFGKYETKNVQVNSTKTGESNTPNHIKMSHNDIYGR